jgi:hypothetical protein
MLTIIYVNEPATVTIEALTPRDEAATMRRYDKQQPPRRLGEVGSAPLERGVYAILSRQAVKIRVTSGDVQTSTLGGKDDWPELTGAATGADLAQVRRFFNELEKGGDVD